MNLLPERRLDVYVRSNYDDIQNEVVGGVSRLLYLIGFTELDVELPMVEEVRARRGALDRPCLFADAAICL